MYFASYSAQRNEQIVEEAGLHVTGAYLETIQEEGGDVTFLWIVAQKSG